MIPGVPALTGLRSKGAWPAPMRDEVLFLLGNLRLFAGVPEIALAGLAASALRVHFREGETLFRRGDPAKGMVLVLDGVVRIHLSDAKGREITLALVGTGEPIGEI